MISTIVACVIGMILSLVCERYFRKRKPLFSKYYVGLEEVAMVWPISFIALGATIFTVVFFNDRLTLTNGYTGVFDLKYRAILQCGASICITATVSFYTLAHRYEKSNMISLLYRAILNISAASSEYVDYYMQGHNSLYNFKCTYFIVCIFSILLFWEATRKTCTASHMATCMAAACFCLWSCMLDASKDPRISVCTIMISPVVLMWFGSRVLSEHKSPAERRREKLEKQLKKFNKAALK